MKVANKELLDKKLKSIAPDIMDNMSIDTFTNIITKYPKKIIGLLLLNQKILSGIGNYLRADILWMSQVSPYRKVKNLSTKDIHNLYHNMLALTWGLYDYEKAIKMRIINKSIKIPSDYKRDFFVYYEDSDIYGNPVKKEELYEGSKKRFIYWCPKYQK
jgi:formamidopyrimidine-DNA glycosylase